MTLSRFLLLLPLLSLATAIPIVNNHQLNPSDLCPLIDILDHELCGESASGPVQSLCALLQKYNASFCHDSHVSHESHVSMSNDALSVHVLHNEYYANANKSLVHPTNATNLHNVCPIINFIEQELCSPTVKLTFDPKELCPLLNLTYTEFCS
jgi:hypothetical protein